jgi:ankyrin repeat domain-containing protein 50
VLHTAIIGGHLEIVWLLLAQGADVHLHGGGYGTALQVASEGSYREIVQELLEQGADVNLQNKGGRYSTALPSVSAKGHLDRPAAVRTRC